MESESCLHDSSRIRIIINIYIYIYEREKYNTSPKWIHYYALTVVEIIWRLT